MFFKEERLNDLFILCLENIAQLLLYEEAIKNYAARNIEKIEKIILICEDS